MPRPKGSTRNKTRLDRAYKAIDALLDSTDPKDKAAGARLFAQYQKSVEEGDKTAIDQTVFGFFEMIRKLELDLEMEGEEIIAVLGEQTEAIEQLIRREVSSMRGTNGDYAV